MLAQGALSVFLLACAAQVRGHGFVEKVIYNEEETLLYNPWEDQYNDYPSRADRRFDDNGPIRDVTSDAIRCNIYEVGDKNDRPAQDVISVQAGENITLRWTPKWIENHFGPVITYLAHCADDDCTTFEAGRDAVWFKIDEAGYDIAGFNESGGSAEAQQTDCWAATTMEGRTDYTLRISESLKSGQYLMRHEIIALHAAEDAWDGTNRDDSPGAQHYMQCIQFNVQSSGEAFPLKEEMVSFPGAYETDDPGLVLNIWWPLPLKEYSIPGPPVWTPDDSGFDEGSDSDSNSGNSGSGDTENSPASGTESDSTLTEEEEEEEAAPAAPTGPKCKHKKKRSFRRSIIDHIY